MGIEASAIFASMSESQISFHVGLGKTASTFLQKRLFPRLEGVHYLPTGRYRSSKQLIAKSESPKILVSREFDRQFEQEVRWFTSTYPQARIIVVFRRHSSWVASQYRRQVKNGFTGSVQDFIDLEQNRGIWDVKELSYYSKIRLIQACCQNPPLVLLYEDLVEHPSGFVDCITNYLGASLKRPVSFRPVHRSYSDQQLKVLQAFCKRWVPNPPRGKQNKVWHWLTYKPIWALFHLVLFAARFLPNRWVSGRPLLDAEYVAAIDEYAADDWRQVCGFADRPS